MKKHVCGLMVAGMTAAAGLLSAAPEASEATYPKWTIGGEFRLRQEMFDHIPILADPPGETRGGLNNYIRFRTQLYAKYDLNEKIGIHGRLANEFRHYYDPENTSWDFPDELVVDNLYLDLRKLLADESLAIRIGRQDLFFAPPGQPFLGNGRLIVEGTPKDGSRTIYFDAVRFIWTGDKLTLNLIGIYNQSDAELLINDQDRDITGYTSAYNDLDESGVVLYGTYKAFEGTVLDLYYIYKNESEWETLTAAGPVEMPELEVHTVGFLVGQKMGDNLKGCLEVAGQMGDRDGQDLEGLMVDTGLRADLMKESDRKPWAKLGATWFSGDDADTGDDERWNPLWGRYPQIGLADLQAYAFDADGAARWSNLIFCYLQAGLNVTKDVTLQGMAGEILAEEPNGPGAGYRRGYYASANLAAKLGKPGLTAKDGLKGHLVAEVFEPGNYYSSVRDTAYFLRWELAYSF